MSKRVVGVVVAGAGVVLVFIATMADIIGISSGGSAELFGKRQIIGTVVGAVVIVAGLVAAFAFGPPRAPQPARKRRSRRPPPRTSRPT